MSSFCSALSFGPARASCVQRLLLRLRLSSTRPNIVFVLAIIIITTYLWYAVLMTTRYVSLAAEFDSPSHSRRHISEVNNAHYALLLRDEGLRDAVRCAEEAQIG